MSYIVTKDQVVNLINDLVSSGADRSDVIKALSSHDMLEKSGIAGFAREIENENENKGE